jgi:hypothetical protein
MTDCGDTALRPGTWFSPSCLNSWLTIVIGSWYSCAWNNGLGQPRRLRYVFFDQPRIYDVSNTFYLKYRLQDLRAGCRGYAPFQEHLLRCRVIDTHGNRDGFKRRIVILVDSFFLLCVIPCGYQGTFGSFSLLCLFC